MEKMTPHEIEFIRAIADAHDMPVNEAIHFLWELFDEYDGPCAEILELDLALEPDYLPTMVLLHMSYYAAENAIRGFEQAM